MSLVPLIGLTMCVCVRVTCAFCDCMVQKMYIWCEFLVSALVFVIESPTHGTNESSGITAFI